AVAASPLMPIGPARLAEPAPGVALDLPALAAGFAAVALLPVAALALSAWRAARATARAGGPAGGAAAPGGAVRPSRLAALLGRAGWVTSATGMRMAFEPGRGRAAVPVRTALAGTALAVGAVVAALVFAASLLGLVATPSRYGQNWDAKGVAGYAAGNNGELLVDGLSVPAIGVDQAPGGRAGGYLTLLSGRAPAGPGEIALGPRTLRALGKRVGQTVRVRVTWRGGVPGPPATRAM